FTGHPQPSARAAAASTAQALAPNPERLRDYSDRLRVLDDRARQQAVAEPLRRPTPPAAYGEPPTPPAPDPLEADRKRREYESLFSSNVVVSRRPDAQRLTTGAATPARTGRGPVLGDDAPIAPPSLDDVAEAVMRATARTAPAGGATPSTAALATSSSPAASSAAGTRGRTRPASTGPITGDGPLHRLLEGTVIDTVLTNRLDGSVAAPVNCLVTNPIYSHDGQQVLIPAGSRVLGETKPVQAYGETRLAVAFNRLVLPDGRTYRLDQFMGLNEIGDAGLRDQVNQHYKSTFGASAAVGLLSGFAQFLGSAGLARGGGGSTVVIAGGVGDATAQSTSQTMGRFLNRLPSITIREGHRVKVYLTNDLDLPAYEPPETAGRSLLARIP
ncbi:MAG: TrbI/VirB10 family protein, partial [Acidobacteriia bacterium]|nr:TrbI/VirB10 family protein [Terriglobia bacterium]